MSVVTTTALNFCENKGIIPDEKFMQELFQNSDLLEKLSSVNDDYTIISKSHISPTDKCKDVYIYLRQLDIIIRTNKSNINEFVEKFRGRDFIYFKPTNLTEEEFRQFVDFVRPELSIKVSKIVSLQLLDYALIPSSKKVKEFINLALDYSNDIEVIQKILSPIINVRLGMIKRMLLAKLFDEKKEEERKEDQYDEPVLTYVYKNKIIYKNESTYID